MSNKVWHAGIKYKVLPFAFVFHMDHPRGDWLKSDVEWSVRGPSTLDRFFLDVEMRYTTSQQSTRKSGMADDVHIVPVATELGQNCSAACANVGLGCRSMKAGAVNTCEALRKAFAAECKECSDMFYGHDLPAYNAAHGKCLLNSKPDEYHLVCAASQDSSKRLCPCGESVAQWFNDAWVARFKSQHNLYGGKP